ncbi:Rieske 2Fe-2S domain-containing protein [Deinococcus sp. QL22]|uniref:Rieske 2Fe-2S domain-containing protein n=1 Tax=Deinococcus sp. QL22 TaxID=2939437 RepID=UPI0035305393
MSLSSSSPSATPPERVHVDATANLPEGSQTEVMVGGVHVVVVRYEGEYYALRNNCTHKDFPLLGGDVSMGRITCAKHGAKFELATGKAKTLPAVKAVQIYKTLVEDGEVYVLAL